jgi:hypothetical protein
MGSVTEPSRAEDSVAMSQDPVRRRFRRPEHGDDQPDQHQLADDLRRHHDGRAGGLCRNNQAAIVSPFIVGGAMAR